MQCNPESENDNGEFIGFTDHHQRKQKHIAEMITAHLWDSKVVFRVEDSMFAYRTYVQDDYQFLCKMLYEAVFWSRSEDDRPSMAEGLSYVYTKHVLEEFGSRKGDIAVIAEMTDNKAGATFIRYWNDDTNIRGYISKDVPVLVIGVVEEFRRQGIATRLM